GGGHIKIGADSRRWRRDPQPDLCGCLQPGSGFFTFYRSMQAYEHGLRSNETRMLLTPDSSFFRYFADPSGKPREKAAPTGRPSAQPIANARVACRTFWPRFHLYFCMTLYGLQNKRRRLGSQRQSDASPRRTNGVPIMARNRIRDLWRRFYRRRQRKAPAATRAIDEKF